MFKRSRLQISPIDRGKIIAATPLFFLVLLALWTILNVSVMSVKADPASSVAIATVKRTSANLREGPGTEYRILGQSLKGATLPVMGKYDDVYGQRWYEVYVRAFGNVWVSGIVVSISPTNATIPFVSFGQTNDAANTPEPTSSNAPAPSSSNTSSNTNSGNNNPQPPQPTAVPGPATTPDPEA
jgi:hypothetical protein